jgi:hypothetical protein
MAVAELPAAVQTAKHFQQVRRSASCPGLRFCQCHLSSNSAIPSNFLLAARVHRQVAHRMVISGGISATGSCEHAVCMQMENVEASGKPLTTDHCD